MSEARKRARDVLKHQAFTFESSATIIRQMIADRLKSVDWQAFIDKNTGFNSDDAVEVRAFFRVEARMQQAAERSHKAADRQTTQSEVDDE